MAAISRSLRRIRRHRARRRKKEAKSDAEWVNHNPHGSRLYVLNVASGKLMLLPVDPDVRRLTGVAIAGSCWPSLRGQMVWATWDRRRVAGWSAWQTRAIRKAGGLPPTIEAAAFAPDGGSIVYLAQAKHDAPPGYADLYVYDTAAKTTRDLSDGFKGSMRRGLRYRWQMAACCSWWRSVSTVKWPAM